MYLLFEVKRLRVVYTKESQNELPFSFRKNILGNSHENSEEIERSNEKKEKEAAL